MSNELSIRYCQEHNALLTWPHSVVCQRRWVASPGSDGDGPCRIVTLHRQTVSDLNAYIWTEEP